MQVHTCAHAWYKTNPTLVSTNRSSPRPGSRIGGCWSSFLRLRGLSRRQVFMSGYTRRKYLGDVSKNCSFVFFPGLPLTSVKRSIPPINHALYYKYRPKSVQKFFFLQETCIRCWYLLFLINVCCCTIISYSKICFGHSAQTPNTWHTRRLSFALHYNRDRLYRCTTYMKEIRDVECAFVNL